MQITSVGILGHGHFGQFVVTLAKRFLPGIEVRVYSRRSEPDGELFYSLADTAAADVVILCGSIKGYAAQLQSILPHLSPDGVVVDVATVKKYTTEMFRQRIGERRWLCCHPMFGAESYRKQQENVDGFRIVVTETTLSDEDYAAARGFLSGLGFKLIEMSAERHDELLADTLFMTHYIGQTMARAGFGRTDIDTVSFQSLMNSVESVAHDEELFVDVYNHNPYCESAAVRFHEAQREVLDDLLQHKAG